MRRRLLVLIAALALLLAAPALALAHQLLVLDAGSGEIDAGTAEPARLIHSVLLDEGDTLTVTARPTSNAAEAVLYVPDQKPERGYDAAQLPALSWTDRGSAAAEAHASTPATTRSGTGPSESADDPVVDEATGIAYREIKRIPLESGATATITVRRGTKPARIALRVGPPTTFAADDLEQTPKLALDARLWADTPLPGTKAAAARDADSADARYAWYGAGIALIGVLVAIWWVLAGRRASRRRGAEKARQERQRESSSPIVDDPGDTGDSDRPAS
ncbi:MAG: hypothetical protein KDC46_11485 [Thermoleophilia bacterium]|nr:hypothetical protein [Thermoleophilia bacterium]